MRANTAELNQSEERLKEYQRQQERLKAMTADKVKSMSADVMIENLLKQNFVKPNSTKLENRINSGSGLPIWLECESTEVPGAYQHLWAFVKTSTNFADTQKVSQLLLTSGLNMEVLGFIWNLSNKAVPGQLNKQEFYIILALVALAQSGYSFNNISVLNLVQSAPIPALQTKVLEKYIRSPTTSNSAYISQVSPIRPSTEDTFSLSLLPPCKTSDHSSFGATTTTLASVVTVNEEIKDVGELKPLKFSKSSSADLFDNEDSIDFPKTSHFPCIGSSPTAELEDEDDFSEFQSACINDLAGDVTKKKEDLSLLSQLDEFTDFQCADVISDPLETVIISQKKEVPKITLPRNLSGKLSNLRTNILKISPESEKKLKVLTQSETLSTLPESKISTNNKVSTMTSISVLPASRDIGMRLANHSLGSKTDKSKHQRHKHKQPVLADEMIFPSKFGTMDELFPKCFQKTSGASKTFVLKETKIGNPDSIELESSSRSDADAVPDLFPPRKNTRKIEIPMLGTFNETTLPTQAEDVHTIQTTVELFSVEEDKYSAFREVELEMKLKNNEPKHSEINANVTSDGVDDFGEFLSAEIPISAATEEADLWGEWSNPDPAPNVDGVIITKPLDSLNGFKAEDVSTRTDNHKNVGDAVNVLNFDLLSLTTQDNIKSIPTIPEFDLGILTDGSSKNEVDYALTSELGREQLNSRDKRIQGFEDFMMFGSPRSDDANQCSASSTLPSNNLDEDFGMFFTSEFTLSSSEANRDDVLPSLNFKTLSSETSEQETIRKKCLMACLNLIQQGLDILNRVSSAVVLREVLSTQEAVNYLNNLNLVYQISRRVVANSGEVLSIQEDIERMWQKLAKYCCDYHIRLKEDLDNSVPMGTQCHVCLGFIGNDVVNSGMSSYHPSCANFWVNCVESELPCPN